MLQRIKWASLKSVDRAIEKLARSYDFNVCRLVDIVRQCIVFEDLEDLTRCLHALTADERVEVLRVKNRFDESYDPRQSGGYRDVCLNVRVVTERTKRLGVAGHVCELVLAMRDIYAVKHEAEHARYLQFKKSARHRSVREFLKHVFMVHRLRKMSNLNKLVVLCSIDCNILQYLKKLFALSRVTNSDETVEMEVKSVDYAELDRTDAILRQRCSFPGDFLEARLREVWFAVKNAGDASVLFTRTPVTHSLYKPWAKVLLILVGVYACVACFSLSAGFRNSIINQNAMPVRSLMFRTLEIASTADLQAVVSSGVSALGLTWDGCEIHDLAMSSLAVNNELVVTYGSQVQANGWYFDPSSLSGEQPVRFQVLASEDVANRDNLTDLSWSIMSASGCTWSTVSPVCVPNDGRKFVYPQHNGNGRYYFDLRSPWYQSIGTVLLYFPVFVFAFCSAIMAAMGQHRMALGMIAASLWVPGIMEMVTAVGVVVRAVRAYHPVSRRMVHDIRACPLRPLLHRAGHPGPVHLQAAVSIARISDVLVCDLGPCADHQEDIDLELVEVHRGGPATLSKDLARAQLQARSAGPARRPHRLVQVPQLLLPGWRPYAGSLLGQSAGCACKPASWRRERGEEAGVSLSRAASYGRAAGEAPDHSRPAVHAGDAGGRRAQVAGAGAGGGFQRQLPPRRLRRRRALRPM
eukprot:768734-Hanusia_phi.AAC.1